MPLTPVIPIIYQGPAVIKLGTSYWFSKSPVTVAYKRDSFKIETDAYGVIDQRMKSDQVEISWTPDGQNIAGNLSAMYPYLGTGKIGRSIFAGGDTTVVIQTLDGRTITWQKGAVSKMPQLRLKPTDTLFGEMAITCLGKSNTQRSDVAYWKAITAVAWAEGTYGFDETKIITDIYKAAWGGGDYAAMGALEGFEIEVSTGVKMIPAADVGIADIVISSVEATARFRPDNLTEAQVDTMLAHQGASALYPGQSFAQAGNSLVIAGQGPSPLTVTLAKAGPKDIQWKYGVGEHIHQMLEFTSKRTFTAGVIQPILAFT